MTDDTLLSPTNIAELASVSRPVVSNWRRRYDDFPKPAGGTDARPLFSRGEIIEWLTNRNHTINTGDTVAAMWAAVNSLRGSMATEQIQLLVLLVFATRQILPDLFEEIEEASPEDVVVLLATAEDQLRAKYPVDEKTRDHLEDPVEEILNDFEAGSLTPIITAVAGADVSRIAEYTDELIERFSRSQRRAGGVYGAVDSRASKLLVALASHVEGTVYDPASGIAEVLINIASNHRATRLVGSEISTEAITTACLRSLLHGVNISFTLGDVIESDPFPDLKADTIVLEPPFGPLADTSSTISDPRFSYGVPTRRGSELLWIQHALSRLADGGTAYVLTSASALHGGRAEQQIRKNLVRAGCVEAIVSLPPQMLPYTGIGLALWVLRAPDENAEKVLMINASEVEHPEIEIPQWLNPDRETLPLIHAPSTSVSITDLIAGDAALIPTRWIETIDSAPDAVKERLATAITSVDESFRDLTSISLAINEIVGLPKARISTIEELIDNDVIERIPGRHTSSQSDPEANIVRPRHIAEQQLPGAQQSLFAVPGETEVGDVLVTTMRSTQAMVDSTGGHQLLHSVEALRIRDTDILDGQYLAHALQGTWNERFKQGAAVTRIPLQEIEIPLIPLGDQQRVSRLLGQLTSMQARARQLISHSASLSSAVLETIRFDTQIEENDLP